MNTEIRIARLLAAPLLCLVCLAPAASAQSSGGVRVDPDAKVKEDALQKFRDEAIERARGNPEVAARQLTNRDDLVRQRAAEEIARLAPADKRRLVEGYRLQEKNERVRLALDWALYRLGKRDALYAVVRALGTGRTNQAEAYLAEIGDPVPLYPFLERASGPALVKLLETLARTGDAATLGQLKPHLMAGDHKVVNAARFAEREITRRLAAN
ncbi:MAG: hypothetical protein LC800_00910 [Acidobacteria bacterium]|nr:hypothetical protein [Acidobacteriota bacterium]